MEATSGPEELFDIEKYKNDKNEKIVHKYK